MKNLGLEVVVIASQRRGNLVVSRNFEWSEAAIMAKGEHGNQI